MFHIHLYLTHQNAIWQQAFNVPQKILEVPLIKFNSYNQEIIFFLERNKVPKGL